VPIERLARQLAHFGVRDVSVPAVETAMQCCFPGGTEGVDDAEVVQRLCQHLWKNPDAA
jgi:hypothetical protein